MNSFYIDLNYTSDTISDTLDEKNKSCVSEKLEGASTPDISAFIS